MASAKEAEQIIKDLTGEYGYLDSEMMDDIGQYNSEYRRKIDENWLRMENAASHSIKVLAKHIYGSGARFVFELLQNAEDNAFEKAAARQQSPFISFKIYPKHIIVDCNEDGFTRPDLKAICSVGESTKSASHGYIGAKGIGFKSVFIAASRVHIQSGNFSFEFRHGKTDPGLGMVRPIWVTPVATIPDPLTRMTLYLHDQGDKEEIRHLKKIILMQFNDLQETCLLFLRKLQQIDVEFYDEDGNLERSKQFRKQQIDEYRVSLNTITTGNREQKTESQIYHITRSIATGLAQSDNRDPPRTDEAQRASSTAEVVLAFPLTGEYKPLITQMKQELFAFLPLRKSDYKFHIHSDFDTNANRQDIVTTSRRNIDIRRWIAITFYQAVLELNSHPTLCYDWPLFLPLLEPGLDAFWSDLNNELQCLIKTLPSLRARKSSSLRVMHEISVLGCDVQDKDGQPLLDHPTKDLFLSSNYSQNVVSILMEYSLQVSTTDQVVDLLEIDLGSDNSKMRGKETTDEWHSAVARLLSNFFERSFRVVSRITPLPLLPLRDEQWTSTASGPVYLPATGDLDIPESLDLRVLCPSSSRNPDRRTLFKHLKVSRATIDEVRGSILRSFATPNNPLSFRVLKSYLQYFYLTHHTGLHTPKDYSKLQVVSADWKRMSPHNCTVYLPGTDCAYSPESLLAAQGTAPGLSVCLLHPDSLDSAPPQPNPSHLTWKTWLCEYVGVRERLSLLSPNGNALSDTFLYVFKHRPEKFLGFLEHLWAHDGKKLLKKQTLITEIQELPAKDLCGVNFALRITDTWLPLTHLKESAERYMEYPYQFPFLAIENDDATQQLETKWRFLNKHFAVGMDGSIQFLLQILVQIRMSHPKPTSVRQTQKVFDLYIALYSKLTVSKDQTEMRSFISDCFATSGILIPDEKAPTWTKSSLCLWAAPPDMVTAYSLKSLYTRQSLSDESMNTIENLFHRTLGLRNATWNNLVTELNELRKTKCEDVPRILGLYEYLDGHVGKSRDMRAAFGGSPLIFVKQQGVCGWYKTSDCLWSSSTSIRGKVTLDETYGGLKRFFVGKLGVKSLTLQMVYNELRQSPQISTNEVKVAILSLNGFLQATSEYLDPEPIRRAKVFPVRYPNGNVSLCSADVDFAIGDRETLRTKFEDRISFLDFDLEDVRRLKPFFDWLRLQHRYLSRCVKEITEESGEITSVIYSGKRALQCKAYHIFRVAATFNSPRFRHDAEALYSELRRMSVVEVEEISSVLRMSQNGQLYEIKIATAYEHIDWYTGDIEIFVPVERKAQEICFGSVLPRRFAEGLMRHPESNIEEHVEVDMVNALTSIFASDRSVLDEILDDQGIIQVSLENQDSSEEEEDDENDDGQEHQDSDHFFEAEETHSEQGIAPNHPPGTGSMQASIASTSFGPHTSFTETVVEEVFQQSHMSRQIRPRGWSGLSRAAPVSHPLPRASLPAPQIPQYLSPAPTNPEVLSSGIAQYRAILNSVVEAARKANFPSGGAFDLQNLRDALPDVAENGDIHESFDGLDVMTGFQSANQQERNIKIGAAGELYVFELLSKLELPNWSRENWQSTIRTYAAIHPDYTSIPQWPGRETADLVYDDTEGQFTSTLVDAGILAHEEWNGKRPKYYIEVKTTTGSCKTPFYMSYNQYTLVQRIHNNQDRSEVYMIFRIYFLLDSGRINYCVYLDPEKLKDEGQLLFTGLTFQVTPALVT